MVMEMMMLIMNLCMLIICKGINFVDADVMVMMMVMMLMMMLMHPPGALLVAASCSALQGPLQGAPPSAVCMHRPTLR